MSTCLQHLGGRPTAAIFTFIWCIDGKITYVRYIYICLQRLQVCKKLQNSDFLFVDGRILIRMHTKKLVNLRNCTYVQLVGNSLRYEDTKTRCLVKNPPTSACEIYVVYCKKSGICAGGNPPKLALLVSLDLALT